jgi:AraC family transcriptional regulator
MEISLVRDSVWRTIENGELGLAEVAIRTGYANQSHFCLHFKRITGVTPRRFRENAKT